MPNNVIYGLLADERGNLWGSTNRGIFCLSQAFSSHNPSEKPRYTIRNFNVTDGLQNHEFNTGALAKLPNGELAFGGVNGFNVFDPKVMLEQDYQPRTFITNISVNNRPLTFGDDSGVLPSSIETTERITLNHLQDILSLDYATLDYTGSMFNRYRYQLLGADPEWIEAGTRRSATYLHLPPGNYTFRVQGSNSRGIWSPHVATLNIKILPPWWRSNLGLPGLRFASGSSGQGAVPILPQPGKTAEPTRLRNPRSKPHQRTGYRQNPPVHQHHPRIPNAPHRDHGHGPTNPGKT
ncbi:MAG: hypothetical protein IPO07_23630 [Haliscomenobacter sp.]|nr:hypothetical protein [Haliscomenobacter sp.]